MNFQQLSNVFAAGDLRRRVLALVGTARLRRPRRVQRRNGHEPRIGHDLFRPLLRGRGRRRRAIPTFERCAQDAPDLRRAADFGLRITGKVVS